MRELFYLLIPVFALTLTLTGCEKEGPAERAGEKIDQVVENTKENLQEAKETVADKLDSDGPAENAGEKVDEAVDKLKEEAEEAKKKAEQAMK